MAPRAYLAVLTVALFAIQCGRQPTDNEVSTPAELVTGETVSFKTPDGFSIFAAWFTSNRQSGRRPTVVLIHPYDQNLGIWIPFVPDLTDAGYHVLAYDVRGHGQSTFHNDVYSPRSRFQIEDFNSMPLDVEGAIGWLKNRSDVDAARIGLVGAALGANVAYVSSGTNPDVKTSVVISLVTRLRQDVLLGASVSDFKPRSILFMASHGDGYTFTSSERLARGTLEPVRVSGYQGAANGLALLNNPAARAELIQWLRTHL
ncbi:MAG: alpha/beta fold hydrolase [Candidatus Latescibacteria bacterium]|nr:alpha/beta fold hydrolase [Candidatus Latescibacterota bacterium]